MLPLVAIATSLVPDLIKLLAGDKAGTIEVRLRHRADFGSKRQAGELSRRNGQSVRAFARCCLFGGSDG
jgi:hypothetical protein